MRRKNRVKKALQGAVEENATCLKTREKTCIGEMKQQDNPSKIPTGRGLGKAGAKRLGHLLKRVVQTQEEPAGKGKASLPKTPVRLFKHQIEKKADNAPEAKSSKQQASKLILSVVSQCKHKGGISMAELKQTLAAEGYDVAKNNRQVNVVTERLVNNETLVRNTRNTSFRLSNKKVMKTVTVKRNTAASQTPTWELKRKTQPRESPKAKWSQRNYKKTAKERGRKQKRKENSGRAAGKSNKQRQAPKLRGKSQKTTSKRSQLPKNRTTNAQKPRAKAKRTQKRQAKQVKSSRQRRKRPKTSSKKHRYNTRS